MSLIPERRAREAKADERGLVLVILSLVLIVLMAFAALAIDIGQAYSQRRQDQSAADMGALAAGIQGRTGGGYSGMDLAVRTIAAKSVPSLTDADWAACTDPGHLATLSTTADPVNGSPCISYGFQRVGGAQPYGITSIRVRLPDVPVATTFGRVVGVNAINTHAVAVAAIKSPFPFPSGLFADQGNGDLFCVLAGSGGSGGVCAGGTSGQFGTFLPYYYQLGCVSGATGSGGGNGPAEALALGLDHQLFPLKSTSDPTIPDLSTTLVNGATAAGSAAPCTEMFPNTVTNNPGFSNQDIEKGMVQGGSGPAGTSFAGRLVGGPYASGGAGGNTLNQAFIDGLATDNAPLWSFLNPSATLAAQGAPLECRVAAQMSPKRDTLVTSSGTPTVSFASLQVSNGLTSGGGVPYYQTPEALMGGCLSEWTESTGPVFTKAIGATMRLTSVPRFWENAPGANSALYHIRYLQPLFITALGQKASGQTPPPVEWAGDNVPSTNSTWNSGGGGGSNIYGVIGQAVTCDMMPQTICKSPDGNPGSGSIPQVFLIQ